MANYGGGFFFHLLRYDRCGKELHVMFSEIADLHARFVAGLPGPYSVAFAKQDKLIKELLGIEPLDKSAYHSLIEERVAPCACGGTFSFDAPSRCPKCGSSDIEKTGEMLTYYD